MKGIKEKFNWLRTNLVQVLIAIILLFGVFYLGYGEFKEGLEQEYKIKNSYLETKEKNCTSELETYKEQRNEFRTQKDEVQRELDVCKINSGKFNLTINNENILSNGVEYILNTSCIEKDVIIVELIGKANNQQEAIESLNKSRNELRIELDELSKIIPEYEKGFLGNDISLTNGQTKQADEGKFLLSLRGTYVDLNFNRNRREAYITLLSKEYTVGLGQQLPFVYDSQNYTLNVQAIGTGSAVFNIHKD